MGHFYIGSIGRTVVIVAFTLALFTHQAASQAEISNLISRVEKARNANGNVPQWSQHGQQRGDVKSANDRFAGREMRQSGNTIDVSVRDRTNVDISTLGDAPAGDKSGTNMRCVTLDCHLERQSGVYEDPGRAISQTVLLVAGNSAYIDMLYNWICIARQYRLKYLVWAIDQETHTHLLERTSIPVYYARNADADQFTGAAFYNSKAFNYITKEKIKGQLQVLEKGYDFYFSDLDVAFQDDPFPGFRAYSEYSRCDVIYQPNTPTNVKRVNVGFYFVRSSSRTILFFQEVLSRFDDKASNDQVHFNDVASNMWMNNKLVYVASFDDLPNLASHIHGQTVVLCALPSTEYRTGTVFREEGQPWRMATVLHYNWIMGHKKKKAKIIETGNWLVNDRMLNFSPECSGVTSRSALQRGLQEGGREQYARGNIPSEVTSAFDNGRGRKGNGLGGHQELQSLYSSGLQQQQDGQQHYMQEYNRQQHYRQEYNGQQYNGQGNGNSYTIEKEGQHRFGSQKRGRVGKNIQ